MVSSAFALDFDETFAGGQLDESRWIPYYLPHWSTWDLAAARYAVQDGQLQLLIAADQEPWCPALDGALKVSSLQTALWAGEPGSTRGQHQFDPPAIVQNGPHDRRLYTPTYGRFETRLTASADPRLMVAFWMIGLGDLPEHSAEICVCEIFGSDVSPGSARIGVGVHPHQDPAVRDEFEQVELPIDVTTFHDYAAEWTPDDITFFIDGKLVKRVAQTIAYPMQFMLGLYEFPAHSGSEADEERYPKRASVAWVRGYRYLG
jgi:hypothetical protein